MKRFLLFLLISIPFTQSFAQRYYGVQEEFGKNRIQYKRFEWRTIKSNNFEFNYYQQGDKRSQEAIKIAEGEYYRIIDLLGYTPFSTMKIFIYNSPTDLAQSNIGLSASTELNGGILNLSKSRVQIAYTGNDSTFKKELVKQISRLFIYDMLYGGSLKEVLQSSLLLSIPEWYMSGMAAYISENNSDPLVMDRMRTAVLRNADKKLSSLTGKNAELVGQALWNYIAVRYGKNNISNILNLTRIIRSEEPSITSTLGIAYGTFIKNFREFYANNAALNPPVEPKENTPKETPVVQEPPKEEPRIVLRDGEIDTDNYVFDADNIAKASTIQSTKSKTEKKTESLSRFSSRNEPLKIKGPTAYQNMLIKSETTTDFEMDPVRKIGLKAVLNFNDLLENNLMKAGIFITPNLRNHDIFLQYDKLDKKIDYSFRFDRRSIDFSELPTNYSFLFTPLNANMSVNSLLNVTRRLQMHQFTATAAYPFSNNFRVSLSPFAAKTNDYDLSDLATPDLHSTYLGYHLAAVFDNTVPLYNKIVTGTRFKVQLDKYYGLTAADGFGKFTIDARHYQPLSNIFILAARVSYGRSFGNSPKVSILGGAENWVNRSTAETISDGSTNPHDLRGILFYDFPGDLRGFDLGKIYGTSHLLTNIELRFPLAQYFSKSSLSSSFLRNFQFVGFTDIGTAWFGNSGPFSRQNSLNTVSIGGNTNPFQATVTNFKDPFLYGYGFGARTTILGYFVKFDYAWGVEDKQVNTPIFYFSFGHGF